MTTTPRQAHWQTIYQTKAEDQVSWFQECPEISLDLIRATGVSEDAAIVDIGGGASRLVDSLIDIGFTSVAVVDLSAKALATSKARLGPTSVRVDWLVADVTTWRPSQQYDVWHDRAAFHFLTERDDQVAYADRARQAVRTGGHVIIGTFAMDGPERCSGLPIVRHDAASIAHILGAQFELIESRRHDHRTPGGVIQRFQFTRFQRRDG